MNEREDAQVNESTPAIISGAELIQFTKQILFLKHPEFRTFLKLSREEADIVRALTGGRQLSEIIHAQFETKGPASFQAIRQLLVRLHESGFLTTTGTAVIESGTRSPQSVSPGGRLKGTLEAAGNFTLARFSTKPRSAGRKPAGAPVGSTLLLCLLLLMAIAGIALLSVGRTGTSAYGFSLLTLQNAPGTPLGYAAWLAGIWVCVGVLLSLKTLISGVLLCSGGCEMPRERIAFLWGLIYFDGVTTDVVRTGQYGVMRLYGIRLLLPFALAILPSLLSIVAPSPLLDIAKQSCFLVGALSVLPLVNTDMNRAIYLLSDSTGGFAEAIDYLRRRYFSRLTSVDSMRRHHLEHPLVLIALTAIWFVAFAFPLQDFVVSLWQHLVASAAGGFTWTSASLLTQMAIIIVPIIILIFLSCLLAVSGVVSALRVPIHQLSEMANKLSRQTAPDAETTARFLGSIPIFAHLSKQDLANMSGRLSKVNYGPGQTVIMQGERGNDFFVIVAGEVAVEVEDERGIVHRVEVLSTGDSFGEIALIENVPRTATIRTLSPATFLRLDRAHFNRYIGDLQGGKEKVTDTIRTAKLLMDSPLFAGFSPRQIRMLISRFTTEWVDPDQRIIEQGSKGECLYLIKEGEVEVRRIESGAVAFSKRLGKGEWFGEIAVLKNVSRTTDVTAVARSCLLSLSKDAFFEVIQRNLLTGVAFDRMAERRLREMGNVEFQ